MSYLKKVAFLAVIMQMYCYPSYSQSFNCYYDGYWGNWKSYNSSYVWGAKLRGGYDGFVIYENREHPSKYFFKFTITGYTKPSKKEIKAHYKTNTWWEYNGMVEYYVCDVYPTLGDCLKQLKRPLLESDTQGSIYQEKLSLAKATRISQTGRYSMIGYKKIRKSATIKIQPYKKHPKTYNIFVDGVGYGIDLDDLYWEE